MFSNLIIGNYVNKMKTI